MIYTTRNHTAWLCLDTNPVSSSGATGITTNNFIRVVRGTEIIADGILVTGITGPENRILEVKFTYAPGNGIAPVVPNRHFVQGDYIAKTTPIGMPSGITFIAALTMGVPGLPSLSTDTTKTWYSEPTYSPQRHELFNWSNSTYGYPVGFNQRFYRNTMYALTGPTMGTNYTWIGMGYRPNTPFGWYNGFGNPLCAAITPQHMLLCSHYPQGSDVVFFIDNQGTQRYVQKLTAREHFPGGGTAPDGTPIQYIFNYGSAYAYTGPGGPNALPNLQNSMGNGVMIPNEYPKWYKAKTGKEIYQDYPDISQVSVENFAMQDCTVQTVKTPLPASVVPVSLGYFDYGKPIMHDCKFIETSHYSSANTIPANLVGKTITLTQNDWSINTENNERTRAAKEMRLAFLQFPESNPYSLPHKYWENNKFYSHLNNMPIMCINGPFARGFVLRSRHAGISARTISDFTTFSNLPEDNGPTANYRVRVGYQKKYLVNGGPSIGSLFSVNNSWTGNNQFEKDGCGPVAVGDSGTICMMKVGNKSIWIGQTLSIAGGYPGFEYSTSMFGLGPARFPLTGSSSTGGAPSYADNKSYYGISNPFQFFDAESKKIFDIMMADKSWQVTTEETNNRVSPEKRIFVGDLLNNYTVNWHDMGTDIGSRYLQEYGNLTTFNDGNTGGWRELVITGSIYTPPVTGSSASAFNRNIIRYYPKIVKGLPKDPQANVEKEYGIPDRKTTGAARSSFETNPMLPTNSLFTLSKIPNFAYFVQDFTLPDVGGEPFTMDYILGPKIKLPRSTATYGNITVKFLVNEDMSNYYSIIKWITETTPYTEFLKKEKPILRGNATDTACLILLTNKKVPFRKIEFTGLIPTELSGLDFSSDATDVNVLSATVKFSISDYKIIDL